MSDVREPPEVEVWRLKRERIRDAAEELVEALKVAKRHGRDLGRELEWQLEKRSGARSLVSTSTALVRQRTIVHV